MADGQAANINPYEGQRTTPGPVHAPVYTGSYPVDFTSMDVYARGVPQAALNAMRREAPVWWHPETSPNEPGFWVLSRHEDIAMVSKDPETFSSAIGAGCSISFESRMQNPTAEKLAIYRATMVHMDPPEHRDYRLLVMPFLAGKAASRLESRVRETVDERIEHVARLGEFDLVSEYSAVTPAITLCHLLGVPPEDRAQVVRWGDTLAGQGDPEYAEAAASVHADLYAYGWGLLEAKRRNPSDDLLSAAIAAYESSERPLRPGSMEGLFSLMVVAGHRTTRNTITAGLLELYHHPDQLALLRDNPDLIGNAVEELLRWTTVVPTFRRTATRDVEIAGQPIAAGEKVVLSYAAANFDEAVFTNAETLDIRRPNAKQHLSFGIGEHFCAGNALARLQLRIAINAFVQRFSKLTVVEAPSYLRANQAVSIKSVRVRVEP
jgi:cytochrome P450